jgi:hypothetical protein
MFIFIGGIHRSGTTLLFDILREHPLISGFSGTGAPMDEGQHLQSVYPSDKMYGGPGRFGFARAAHLTEVSQLVTERNRERLLADWTRYGWRAIAERLHAFYESGPSADSSEAHGLDYSIGRRPGSGRPLPPQGQHSSLHTVWG